MFLFLTQMLSSCRGESKTNTMRTWVSLSSTLSRLQLFNQHIQVQGHQEGYDFPAIFPQFASTESLASSSDTDRSPTLHTCLSLRRHPLRQEQSCLVTGHSPEMSTPGMRITTRHPFYQRRCHYLPARGSHTPFSLATEKTQLRGFQSD